MVNIGDSELTIMIGDTECSAVYAGDVQIYPNYMGILTGISLENLTWVTDVSAAGGTATSANCSFDVYAYYDSGKSKRVTKDSTVTGSLVVPATTADTREIVGTLTLTADYSGFTDSDTVDVYQKAQTYNYIINYTTTDGVILTLTNTTGWSQNIVSHTYGRIEFDDDVTMIPNAAFSGCGTLQTINIPDTVTSYGDNAFNNCSGMTAFRIGSTVNSIGEGCFYLASGELTIDSQYACSGNGSTAQTFADNWKYSFAYKFCQKSESNRSHYFTKLIITADTVTWLGQNSFSQTFNSNQSPIEIYIGDYVTVMGGMAFRSPNAVTKITIGSGITKVGAYCFFAGLTSCDKMYWYAPTAPTLGNSASNVFNYAKNVNTCEFHYPVNGTGYTNWKTGNLSNWQFINDL